MSDLRLLDAAEGPSSRQPGVLRLQTLVLVVVLQQREMSPDLAGQLVFGATWPDQGHDPHQELSHGGGRRRYGSFRSSFSTSPANRRQRWASLPSARAPARVNA